MFIASLVKPSVPPPKDPRPKFTARALTPQLVEEQIKTKIDTFINWDLQACLPNRRTIKLANKDSKAEEADIMKTLLKFVQEMKRKEKLSKNRRHGSSVENIPISENQRDRFAKMSNPLQFIEYYTKNQKFEPKEHQQTLINKLVEIKALLESMQSLHLEKVLTQIYQLMNMIVDFNELRLLVLVIVLVADVCYQVKDFNRAVYFYHQAKIAGEISCRPEIVTESLIGLSKVCYDLGLSSYSIKFLKKALAYSWQQNDQANETEIYDILGQNYCLEGKMSEAKYYHERFIQNYAERENSAIRKIYIEIVKDDSKDRNLRLYTENVDLLFLQTISLPIWNFSKVPASNTSISFNNFIDGESPRKNITNKDFDYEVFPDAEFQVKGILEMPEFRKEMPNPNIQTLYTPRHRYGKKKRDVDFSRTVQFREITHTKLEVDSPHRARKYSIEKQIEIMLSDKPDPELFLKISENVKRQRLQKLGSLKEPVRKTHLKTQQRKRTCSTQSQNIRKSINKAILSWIDPPQ